MWCNFLIFKTNYFWSNRGIVCLIISVLGPTQTQNILHEKKSSRIRLKSFSWRFQKWCKKKLNHLVKTYSFRPYMTRTVNPAVTVSDLVIDIFMFIGLMGRHGELRLTRFQITTPWPLTSPEYSAPSTPTMETWTAQMPSPKRGAATATE